MNFEEARSYLLSLGNEVSAMKLGLESMTRLLHALGDPHDEYLKVQVAGTNGKGSVCAFLEAICREAGIKVGLTTSPHLISITERVRVGGENIIEARFADLATRVRAVAEDLVVAGELETVPTYFEQVTAIALLSFAEAKVELAILETGLGGRLDATTAANAEIVVITRIDLDHQQYLGETIEAIAAEKAAIVKRGSIVAVGKQRDEAMALILDRCSKFGINPRLAKNVTFARDENGLRFKTSEGEYQINSLGLIGQHQFENAISAILAVEILADWFEISKRNIETGLMNARHPGRLEFQGRYLFDGAHNIGGAKALRQFLDEEIDKPITLVFGAMNDKAVAEIGEMLFPRTKNIVLVRIDSPRAMQPDQILRSIDRQAWRHKVVTFAEGTDIVKQAETLAGADGLILVTGSLYLVGEVQRLLRRQSEI